MPDYNYYCGNCLYRLDEDVENDHERVFHCDGEILEEFDNIKFIGNGWIYDIFEGRNHEYALFLLSISLAFVEKNINNNVGKILKLKDY